MKKGGGGKNYQSSRVASRTSTNAPRLFAPVRPVYTLSRYITIRPSKFLNDHHWDKREVVYKDPVPNPFYEFCKKTGNACKNLKVKIEEAYNKFKKQEIPPQATQSPQQPLQATQRSQSHSSQSHSSHLPPIQELQPTTCIKRLIQLPLPQRQQPMSSMLPQPMRRKFLNPLPNPIQRSSPKK
uniref:Uncharacterized protein n=1 Tax=viral metagenome TaxID=1070528 RepID=A0A6C0LKR1_9ZZZZ